ncbi:hypothetical protein L484_019474 [Morus notabilis]|uniref:Transmembrane protein n=1 Tax=Morus notabilis TaxID=981085 RepID=W9SFJ5_9ROSA|nr:hypothetical protein L484_019474 [Morus notabilis]
MDAQLGEGFSMLSVCSRIGLGWIVVGKSGRMVLGYAWICRGLGSFGCRPSRCGDGQVGAIDEFRWAGERSWVVEASWWLALRGLRHVLRCGGRALELYLVLILCYVFVFSFGVLIIKEVVVLTPPSVDYDPYPVE